MEGAPAPPPEGDDRDCIINDQHGWRDVSCDRAEAYICKAAAALSPDLLDQRGS